MYVQLTAKATIGSRQTPEINPVQTKENIK
jgi:hypothetical protein